MSEEVLRTHCATLQTMLMSSAKQLHEAEMENARLKAEVERLKGIILAQSSDFVRSKTSDDGIKPEGHNDLAGRAVERCLELQAEVERLRKAGDDLGWAVHRLKERFWDADEEANKAVQAWNAAKEGKPSV